MVTEAASLAGEYLIEVTGNTGLPGAYRIEVRELGDCSSVSSPTLPLTQVFNFSAGQVRCLDVPLAADEAFEAVLEQRSNGTQYDLLLVGPDGQVWGQQDNQPQGGSYPTGDWTPHDPVIDRYSLSLRDDAPPGDYRLLVGMYDLSTGLRLPAFAADGQRLPDDAIQVAVLPLN